MHHPVWLRLIIRAALTALIATMFACGGGTSDGSGDAVQCPNGAAYGNKVATETCAETSECGCGLFCSAGSCAPYTGEFSGCWCDVDPNAAEDDTGSSAADTGANTSPEPEPTGPDLSDCDKGAPMGWPCNPYCNIGCDEGQHCTFSNGAGACRPAGDGAIGETCAGDSCSEGHACIKFTDDPDATCRQFCVDDADCPEGRKCNMNVNSMFTVCSEPTVGCNVFDDPSTACPEGEGCYYSNQASKCMPAGTKAGGSSGAQGSCGILACTTDAECQMCTGGGVTSDDTPGQCGGGFLGCTEDAECQLCDETTGTCASDNTTACDADTPCTSTCEGFIPAGTQTEGLCASDNLTPCLGTEDCTAVCEGGAEASSGEVCDGPNDCAPGFQCLVVCTEVCSLDGAVGSPCSACPSGAFNTVSQENNMGVCLGSSPPAACNLYTQDGCDAGQGCYSVTGGHSCLNAGSIPEGSECKFTNDCVPGSICINSMCVEACNLAEDAPAAETCDVKCDGTSPGTLSPSEWQVGFCKDAPPSEPCTFWEQDCTGGKVCYGTMLGEACLQPQGTGGEGTSCSRNPDCAAGLVCPNYPNSPNNGLCTRPCSIIIPDYEGPKDACTASAECALPYSCVSGQCKVPYCANDCPNEAGQPVTTESQIGTCDAPIP